jgi:hypothetical protein
MNKIKYPGCEYELDGPHTKTFDQDDVLIYVFAAFVIGLLVGLLGAL